MVKQAQSAITRWNLLFLWYLIISSCIIWSAQENSSSFLNLMLQMYQVTKIRDILTGNRHLKLIFFLAGLRLYQLLNKKFKEYYSQVGELHIK